MEIRCGNCDARLRVPDEKLSGDGPHTALCPMCNKEVLLESPEGEAAGGSVSTGKSPPRETGGTSGAWAGLSPPGSLGRLTGERVSLLLETDPQQLTLIRKALEALGYVQVTAENTREAMGKLRFHHFDAIVLSDHFDETAWEESPILNYLNTMPVSARRRTFVALIGEDFRTLDPVTAFSLSVELVAGRSDMGDFQRILEQCLAEKEKFYHVFMEMLAETGRA